MPLFQGNIKILDLEIPSNPSVTHPPFSFSGVLIAPKYIFIFPHGLTLVPQCRTLFYLGFISTYLQLVTLFDLLFALRNISYLFIFKAFSLSSLAVGRPISFFRAKSDPCCFSPCYSQFFLFFWPLTKTIFPNYLSLLLWACRWLTSCAGHYNLERISRAHSFLEK